MKNILSILAISTLCSVGTSNAATLITATTNDYVRSGNNASSSQDGSEVILVKGTSGSGNLSRFAYIRFALTNEQKAEIVMTTTTVTLDIYFISGNDTTIKVYGLTDGANGMAGTTETTWSTNLLGTTRPDGNSPNLANSLTTLMGDTLLSSSSAGSVVSLTLGKTAFDALINADTNNEITLILGDTTNSAANTFASLTNTNSQAVPTLNVIPEPSTFALVGLGLFGLMRRRRS